MSEKYGEIKIMNQDEYINYYNRNSRGHELKKSMIYEYSRSADGRQYYHIKQEWPCWNSYRKKPEIVVYDSSEPIVYLKSDQILNTENNDKLLDNLKKNNTYIIHVIGREDIHYYYDSISNRNEKRKKTSIFFIDNCCNYYQSETDTNSDYYPSFIANQNISNKQLPKYIIDSIKNMKNIINDDINQYLDLLNQINLNISALDEENKTLKIKLDEQLKVNEMLSKRLFELI